MSGYPGKVPGVNIAGVVVAFGVASGYKDMDVE